MATPTYTPLATTTLASAASSVTFSSIDQSYGDLVLVIQGFQTAGRINPTLNGDTGSNYSYVSMQGNGSGTTSSSGTNAFIKAMELQASNENILLVMQFLDYSATDKHKTIIHRTNLESEASAFANRYASTSGITSIEIPVGGGGTLEAGTTLSLYGIAK